MQKKYYLAACCILKDEDPFIVEWLTYHSLVGVEHFFIYDNESANPLAENPLILKFAAQGKATVLSTPGKTMQRSAYTHCLQQFGPLCKWIAFLDLDEFICPMQGRDLRPMLAAYEEYASLGLSWKCFSSGGHLSSPKGLVIKNYQERFFKEIERNLHIKSIIQPEKNSALHTPHSFWPNAGEVASDTAWNIISPGNPMIPMRWEKITLHHYILKSQQDAQRRMARGRADIPSDRPTIDYSDFYSMVLEPVEHDDSIVRFAEEVEGWISAMELPETHYDSLNGLDGEQLLGMAEIMLTEKKLEDAGIVLCHAALTQSENFRLWQTRSHLAALQGNDDLAALFAEKSTRVKAGLPSGVYPKPGPEKNFSDEEAEELEGSLKKLVNEGKNEEAEERLEKLSAEYRLTAGMWLIRGEVARDRKELALAEDYLTTAMSLDENLNIYLIMLQLKLDQQEYQRARELAFYIIYTGTYRIKERKFYEPLEKMLEDLRRITSV